MFRQKQIHVCVVVGLMIVFTVGCSRGDIKNTSGVEQDLKILSPVTLVGRVSSVQTTGLSVMVIDPSQLSRKPKLASGNFIETDSGTKYLSVTQEPTGDMVPRKAPRTVIKSGNIITIEAKLAIGRKTRIIATTITVSPEPNKAGQAREVDHGRESLVAGKVRELLGTGFMLDDMNGRQISVLANKDTPMVSGSAGGLLSSADYSTLTAGIQVTVLGEQQADGTFKATQIAATR